MLCPNCGKDVGHSLSLCASCAASKAQSVGVEEESEEPKAIEMGEEDRINRLYKETLGVSKTEDCFHLLSHPFSFAIIGIISFVLVYWSIYNWAPKLGEIPIFCFSLAAFSFAVYACLYVLILLDLYYIDRTAFFLCLGGMVCGPGLAFLYREDIGVKKIMMALSAFIAGVAFVILAIFTTENPQETYFRLVLGVHDMTELKKKGPKARSIVNQKLEPKHSVIIRNDE